MTKFKIPKVGLSVQLLLVFMAALLLGAWIPLTLKAFCLSVSITLKECLIFLLPFVIFSCLFCSIIVNQGRVVYFVLMLLLVVCVSNLLSILAAYGIGTLFLGQGLGLQRNLGNVVELVPLWKFMLPPFISNQWALIGGFGFGILVSIFPHPLPIAFGKKMNQWVTIFLEKIFIPVLPLFALGFILKMQHEGILIYVLERYSSIILLIVVANSLYLFLMFFAVAGFRLSKCLAYIKNVLPASFLGFTTMSSLAAMPVTLAAAEKNTGESVLARAIIPATVNIHMVGDSISIPIVAMGVLLTFGQALPNFSQYLQFTQFVMLAKFAVPGVPSGSILVMLPIFEQCLGFTSEMSAFTAAIYILFDSVVTGANVLGNSALVIFLSSVLKSKQRVKES